MINHHIAAPNLAPVHYYSNRRPRHLRFLLLLRALGLFMALCLILGTIKMSMPLSIGAHEMLGTTRRRIGESETLLQSSATAVNIESQRVPPTPQPPQPFLTLLSGCRCVSVRLLVSINSSSSKMYRCCEVVKSNPHSNTRKALKSLIVERVLFM